MPSLLARSLKPLLGSVPSACVLLSKPSVNAVYKPSVNVCARARGDMISCLHHYPQTSLCVCCVCVCCVRVCMCVCVWCVCVLCV